MSNSPWVMLLCAVVAGCDAGAPPTTTKVEGSAATRRSLNPQPKHQPDSFLDGPPPRQELRTADLPTESMINHELGGTYAMPELNTSVVGMSRGQNTPWTRYYDGIELEYGANSLKMPDGYVTHFVPEFSGPERPQRDKLISEKKALELAAVETATKATLIYSASFVRRRIRGRSGTNAMDYVNTIDCWQLVYRVEGQHDGAILDAYTGEQIRHWSNHRYD